MVANLQGGSHTMRKRWLAASLITVLVLSTLAAGPAAGQPPQAPAVNTILTQPGDAFIHLTNSANLVVGPCTLFDEVALNGNPNLGLFAINQINAYGSGSLGFDHPVGVAYFLVYHHWGLLSEDGVAQPENVAWNVLVPAQDLLLSTQRATPANTI